VMQLARNVIDLFGGKRVERLDYRLEGKLSGPAFGSTRFHAQGALELPRVSTADSRANTPEPPGMPSDRN
jgi:hypothetical protein